MFPTNLLADKKVLVGVTGSISVYKSLELIRHLTKAGAQVRVIMTEGATRFVSKLTFETLSGNQVLDETSENWHSDHNHIGIGKWADLFIIAPATANTINKLAHGIADNLLTQTALAYEGEKLLAPAANTVMIKSPLTQASMASLKGANFHIINTQSKELACRTEGDGALADPLELFYHVARLCLKESFWEGRHAFVTGGGTIEAIDDVRYLSNYSSGKMAASLAIALFLKGATVHLITTKEGSELPQEVELISVKSAQQMYEALTHAVAEKSKSSQKEAYLFMAAAVGDYKPSSPTQGKLKKDQLGPTWTLALEKNLDILESIDNSSLKAVGFKAEMDPSTARESAQKMLTNKALDAVALNVLTNSSSFGSDDNAFDLITKEGMQKLERSDKLTLSFNLLKHVQNL